MLVKVIPHFTLGMGEGEINIKLQWTSCPNLLAYFILLLCHGETKAYILEVT